MRLYHGDCLDVLRELDDCSVDAVVTDPPYGINFMGKAWDGAAIEEAARRREEAGPSPARAATGRTTTGFTNSDYAGAYDVSIGRYGDERDWSKMGGPSGRDTKHSKRGGAMRAGTYDLSGSGMRGFQTWTELWAREAFRVLRPGGHLLCFAATRTYHRMACGVEEAGFEIRDCLAWMFGSGFPKSHNVEAAIAALPNGGACPDPGVEGYCAHVACRGLCAKAWEGWGTALKPAFEPIVLARKPLSGTVTANVLEHRTGALNIDACRIEAHDAQLAEKYESVRNAGPRENAIYGKDERERNEGRLEPHDLGRWPANVLLDEAAAAMLDEQTGASTSRSGKPRVGQSGDGWGMSATGSEYDDSGGASRFFYCAKVSRAERNAGLEAGQDACGGFGPCGGYDKPTRNAHPTVKPIDLMRWLIRLITPPDGTVLDPFLGSGSTGCAAALEGRPFIGIEREPDYMRIAEARIAFWNEHGENALAAMHAQREREQIAESGQIDLFDVLDEAA